MNKKSKMKLAGILAAATLTSACGLPGLGTGGVDEEGITIATQASTEMVILGYIMEGMVEHYIDVDAQVVQNLGSSTMVTQAIQGGDANVAGSYYTGTVLTGELGMEPITDPDEAFEVVVEEFEQRFNQKFYPSYGFENTYAFLVTQELANEHNLEVVSDLEAIADEVSAGVDNSWMEREGDGYTGFVETYGFEFSNINPMQVGLVYDALAEGEHEVVLGYSTDGRIASYDLVFLEDDRNFFPPYDANPSATFEVLEAYEELDAVIEKLEGAIDTETMQELNYISDDYLIEPATVAREFLEANNYFEDVGPELEPVGGGE
jgi:osmoprotectant transport system substrate-binding protein